jgi:hypothetical protein
MDSDPLEDTTRLDRRHRVLVQIEAALLAGRLEVEDIPSRATGTNPYDRGPARGPAHLADQWGSRRR